MLKQLNGPVLKSLKNKRSGLKSKKKDWPGRLHAKILYFVSGLAGPDSGRNFNSPFMPGRDGPEKFCPCRSLPGPLGEVPSVGVFLRVLTRIYANFGVNHGKLRMARSTNMTGY